MNDPRENKERVINVDSGGPLIIPERIESETKYRFRKHHLDYSKLFCTTVDADKNPFGLNTKRCFGRPRMWAQYGDNHQGVCLVFDRKDLEDKILASLDGGVLWSDEVIYDDGLKEVSAQAADVEYDLEANRRVEAVVREQIEQFKHALFFRKDSDWSGESEWRYVIRRELEGYERIPFGNSLRAIVIGVDCYQSYMPTLRSLAEGIPLIQLEWDTEKEDFYCRET